MEKKPHDQDRLSENVPETEDALQNAPAEEENPHGNYLFALKVLGILIAIIIVIVILKASGVPIAIKDWLFGTAECILPALHL